MQGMMKRRKDKGAWLSKALLSNVPAKIKFAKKSSSQPGGKDHCEMYPLQWNPIIVCLGMGGQPKDGIERQVAL